MHVRSRRSPCPPMAGPQVGQDVAEQIRADDHVEPLRDSARSARSRMSMWYWSARTPDRRSAIARKRWPGRRSDRPPRSRRGARPPRARRARSSRASPGASSTGPAAAAAVVAALAGLERGGPSTLPMAEVERQGRRRRPGRRAAEGTVALSAPLRLAYGETRWRVPRWRIAPLLKLPGRRQHGGLDRRPRRRAVPREALGDRLAQAAGRALPGRGERQDRDPARRARPAARPAATAKAIAAAAFSTDRRTANLVVRVAQPARTTEKAQSMGIQASSPPTRRPTAARRATPQRPARRAADRRDADRAGRRRSLSTARPASARRRRASRRRP